MNHTPVLIGKILEVLQQNFLTRKEQEKNILDCTFGAGGYSRKILESDSKIILKAVDQDPLAFSFWKNIEQDFPGRGQFFNVNFAQVDELLLRQNSLDFGLDGIIFDLGVSSMQLDDKARGFSFSGDPVRLDMRMNPEDETKQSAYDFINSATEKELADIIYYYGGETHARKIARQIEYKRMNEGPIETTTQLAQLVARVVGYRKNSYKAGGISIHPATKTFQAIRIHINQELENLIIALQNLVLLLKPGGIMIIVSFHSLEDKIIKSFFNFLNNPLQAQPEMIQNFSNIAANKEFFNNASFRAEKQIIVPDAQELSHNIRARSAKMRILYRN